MLMLLGMPECLPDVTASEHPLAPAAPNTVLMDRSGAAVVLRPRFLPLMANPDHRELTPCPLV